MRVVRHESAEAKVLQQPQREKQDSNRQQAEQRDRGDYVRHIGMHPLAFAPPNRLLFGGDGVRRRDTPPQRRASERVERIGVGAARSE